MLPSSSLLVLDFIQATNGVVISQNMEVCVNQFQLVLVWAGGGEGRGGGWECKLGGKCCVCNGKMSHLLMVNLFQFTFYLANVAFQL